ncbi:MAG: permease [Gammaproteobacteria bacterium HGW-Gammaproteobacteria-8]|nr:MAG: permease [Gammaproteobacteria bacterium HGW-Gammaproteobacteria-8]
MAGAAVGVSHLVQATRAGADYGLMLLGLVLLGCAAKYPFLEFGPRYAAATGEHMIRGYRRMGFAPAAIYLLITLATMLTVLASITLVTAGLAGSLLQIEAPVATLAAWILAACCTILAIGHYRGLDLLMKLIMGFLALATLVAVSLALEQAPPDLPIWPSWNDPLLRSGATLAFALALLGWMPIPLDSAAWHSLWTLERARNTGVQPSTRHAATDFAIGYGGAVLLAVAFLVLGAVTLYGREAAPSASAVAFATRLVDLYANSLGEWSRPLIAFAALATMVSTTLTVADAYPRVLRAYLELDESAERAAAAHRARYLVTLALLSLGAWLIIDRFGSGFTRLIDFTTTVSFLSAPVIAWLNLKLLTGPNTPASARPGRAMRIWAWSGFGFLTLFSLIWVGWRLFI